MRSSSLLLCAGQAHQAVGAVVVVDAAGVVLRGGAHVARLDVRSARAATC